MSTIFDFGKISCEVRAFLGENLQTPDAVFQVDHPVKLNELTEQIAHVAVLYDVSLGERHPIFGVFTNGAWKTVQLTPDHEGYLHELSPGDRIRATFCLPVQQPLDVRSGIRGVAQESPQSSYVTPSGKRKSSSAEQASTSAFTVKKATTQRRMDTPSENGEAAAAVPRSTSTVTNPATKRTKQSANRGNSTTSMTASAALLNRPVVAQSSKQSGGGPKTKKSRENVINVPCQLRLSCYPPPVDPKLGIPIEPERNRLKEWLIDVRGLPTDEVQHILYEQMTIAGAQNTVMTDSQLCDSNGELLKLYDLREVHKKYGEHFRKHLLNLCRRTQIEEPESFSASLKIVARCFAEHLFDINGRPDPLPHIIQVRAAYTLWRHLPSLAEEDYSDVPWKAYAIRRSVGMGSLMTAIVAVRTQNLASGMAVRCRSSKAKKQPLQPLNRRVNSGGPAASTSGEHHELEDETAASSLFARLNAAPSATADDRAALSQLFADSYQERRAWQMRQTPCPSVTEMHRNCTQFSSCFQLIREDFGRSRRYAASDEDIWPQIKRIMRKYPLPHTRDARQAITFLLNKLNVQPAAAEDVYTTYSKLLLEQQSAVYLLAVPVLLGIKRFDAFARELDMCVQIYSNDERILTEASKPSKYEHPRLCVGTSDGSLLSDVTDSIVSVDQIAFNDSDRVRSLDNPWLGSLLDYYRVCEVFNIHYAPIMTSTMDVIGELVDTKHQMTDGISQPEKITKMTRFKV